MNIYLLDTKKKKINKSKTQLVLTPMLATEMQTNHIFKIHYKKVQYHLKNIKSLKRKKQTKKQKI